ncbi:hypothetical protein [Rhizobium sp. CSW-27]|uniref:hypothetical protein n=1 Tax=Rhizobium sp. CSW-27 TaxID=2839985 RepID=UPI001C016DA5|nr:hypothetical protein [Rhizobium sp. CSW-27]MBT9370946.1 hypothetical protein [Rhizobium sp. CSW-27]
MKRVIALAFAALIGASTVVFAEDLRHAANGRLSIHSVGDWVAQDVVDHGQVYQERYQVQPDHTLKLMQRTALVQ